MLFIPEAYSHYVMREGSATHPLKLEDALLNEISLYKGIERVLLKYNVSNETIDKCNAFFKRKFVARFMAYVDVNLKTEYTCDYLDELFDKRIVIYGAGNVGKSVYEQITSYEKIKIVGWVDKNYKEIHCDYRNICAPDIIQSLDYDYILIAVENEDIAKQIKENLIESHVEKDDIMWRPYKRSVALTFGKDEV
jgi:FlaA1/EpsC-like NDP-sugar epimerase